MKPSSGHGLAPTKQHLCSEIVAMREAARAHTAALLSANLSPGRISTSGSAPTGLDSVRYSACDAVRLHSVMPRCVCCA